MRICPHCEQEFEPKRLNSKYCSRKCQYTYNNRKARQKRLQKKVENTNTIENLNRILMRNRNILQKYAGQTITVEQLQQENFNFNYITYFQKLTGKRKRTGTAFFCYEYGYQIINGTTVEVTSRQLKWDALEGTLKIEDQN